MISHSHRVTPGLHAFFKGSTAAYVRISEVHSEIIDSVCAETGLSDTGRHLRG